MIGDCWGVSGAEIERHYPCDDVVPDPAMQAWRGVTVVAPAEQVWPWLLQLRLAPYSYDWLDNLGRRSPRELRGLAEPQPGEPFTTAATRSCGRVVSVTPGEQLTGRIVGSVMSYVLVPDGASTRLLLKIVMAKYRALAPLVCVGDLVMARRQLLNFKQLAEQEQRDR